MYDIAIIGAGASGLFAGTLIKNQQIAIIDTNSIIASKIKISGGGKCNITNMQVTPYNYLANYDFIKPVLDKFNNNDLINFLNSYSLYPKIKDAIVKGQYFFKSSNEIISLLKRLNTHNRFFLNTKVLDIDFNDHFIITTSKDKIYAKKVIVASGSEAYPILNASGIGYKIASKFGHKIIKTSPALVGFSVQKEQFWFKELSGLSVEVEVKVEHKKFIGNMLFTHRGCSGPAILNASLYWKRGVITVNFLPSHNSYIPKKLKSKLKEHNIDPTNYSFAPAGTFGYTKAEVSRGGVDTSQVDSNNMQSKLQDNLYFIGEVLDVTGELGGYNFQWAFSSAFTLAKAITKA